MRVNAYRLKSQAFNFDICAQSPQTGECEDRQKKREKAGGET